MVGAGIRDLVLLAMVGGVPSLALAQGSVLDFGLLISQQSRPSFSIIGAGARAAGMGGAFTALADDASAASFNPAGLALLLTPEVSAVGSWRRFEQEDSRMFGLGEPPLRFYDSRESADTTNLTFAAFTVPTELAGRNLCLQLSFQRVIDFDVQSDRQLVGTRADGSRAWVRQAIDQSGAINTFSLASAYQLTPRLSVGASLHRWQGDWTFTAYNELREGGDTGPYFRYRQVNDVEGWSWDLGVLLRYRYLNLGFIYRSPFDANLGVSASATSNFLTQLDHPKENVPLHWPSSWTLGLAVKPTETWRLTLDFARYNWSQMELRDVDIDQPDGTTRRGAINFFDFEPSAETTTQDAGNWRVGTEYTFFAGRTPLQLRAGYFRDEQPQRPLLVDEDRDVTHGYTAGVGAKLGPFAVDLAYQYSDQADWVVQFVDPRAVVSEAPVPQQFAVSRRVATDQRVYLSFLYQLSREKVDRALRFLLVEPETK